MVTEECKVGVLLLENTPTGRDACSVSNVFFWEKFEQTVSLVNWFTEFS